MRHKADGVENRPPVVDRKAPSTKGDSTLQKHEGLTGYPIKEKSVSLIRTTPEGRLTRNAVVLKVYSTNFGGRYAVVAQDKILCRDGGYVNLRHCTVKVRDDLDCTRKLSRTTPLTCSDNNQRSGHGSEFTFEIVSHKNDGQKLVFSVESKQELEQWLAVLTDSEVTDPDLLVDEILASDVRRRLNHFSPTRIGSPRSAKHTLMPPVEEE